MTPCMHHCLRSRSGTYLELCLASSQGLHKFPEPQLAVKVRKGA